MSIIIRDATNPAQAAAVSAAGAVNVTLPSASGFPTGAVFASGIGVGLFDDTFAILDTINRWNPPISAGGGVAAAVIAGNGFMTLGTGTNANGYSYIVTQAMFNQAAPGFLIAQAAINLEYPITANTYRFWGFGSPMPVPSAAAPFMDAIGWEVATSGKMYAICYATGARQVVQDLSSTGNSKQVTDNLVHKYILYYRGDLAYWCIDTLSNVVATMPSGALGPVNNTLQKCCMAIAGSSAPSSSGVLQLNSEWIGDTTGQPLQISDGTYQWRKAVVNAAGALSVLPANCGIIGLPVPGDASYVGFNALGNLTGVASATPLPIQEQPNGFQAEFFTQVLAKLEAIRLAVVATACDGGRFNDTDFDPENFTGRGEKLSN